MLVLRAWLDDPQGTHVCGNQFFYAVEGDPTQVFCPDVYVIRGIAQRPLRRIWKLWDEPEAVPDLIIELASASSWVGDLGAKRALYEALGVDEYVVFDVLGEAVPPRLRLWRLEGSHYVEQPGPEPQSRVLGARLSAEGPRLRVLDASGVPIPGPEERVRREAARADDAEARLAAALAELAQLRGDPREP